ncbi:methylated-DNA--[protein]-cysteine S-methyltransferase [Phragmitibacter flavus]|uniref:Methylated-DNA--protein-cysteine methyltransferase n=1 Tax=Phragmitibacter flavus TaxID=2576071 RepID=A0A5R8KK61_9BACT|nr:methylated-DNA--[protein]-cysteine S-methyltransferase [Phragmitibacter flavus]TLD72708.1 methylated-DNA--[protein]-cysteine S-methyltransferase [Phragmitibacter flavus]
MNPIYFSYYASPVGTLLLSSHGQALNGVWIVGESHAPRVDATWVPDEHRFAKAKEQFDAYFAGELQTFDLEHAACMGTGFQQQVWKALAEIPYGSTISYAELARRIGNPAAVRAVGSANGRNPISIIVPCHRVIGANGSLTGYGGGLAAKKWLLEHEARHAFSTFTLQ